MATVHVVLLCTLAGFSACSSKRSAPSRDRQASHRATLDSSRVQGQKVARDMLHDPDSALSRARTSADTSVDSTARMNGCLGARKGELRISAHCVGPIAWDSTLNEVRHHFPKLIESQAYLEATPIVIWTFLFGGSAVVASQQDDRMNPASPADYWVASGPGIILPGGGRLPVRWGDFRKRYSHGLTVSSGELGITASTCQMPGLDFGLDFGSRPPATLEVDSIPPDVQIDQVRLDRGHPPSDSLVSC